ncbi:MAG: hypothetical protein AB1791_07775 [Chloroflexota bacterium]
MRFLIHELPYERPLAAGRFRYEHEGRPTGQVEEWRLTTATDGYHFLRVDVDGRAAGGLSRLYHLTIGPAGRPERLQFQAWGADGRTRGSVMFETSAITLSSVTNGQQADQTMEAPAEYVFGVPVAAGLGLLAQAAGQRQEVTAAWLNDHWPFSLEKTTLPLRWREVKEASLDGQAAGWRLLEIEKSKQVWTVWLDENDRPRQAAWNGWTAVETRYLDYGRVSIQKIP